MADGFAQFFDIFSRNQVNIQAFMNKLSPVIATTSDEHKRLYYHHIFEEEEQHLNRLGKFLPKLSDFIQSEYNSDVANPAIISLLQDINLEKFGLHNFLEHLDLSLYEFTDEESQTTLRSMLEQTRTDYLLAKEILTRINEEFLPENNLVLESYHHHVATSAHDIQQEALTSSPSKHKKFSVGSLKPAL